MNNTELYDQIRAEIEEALSFWGEKAIDDDLYEHSIGMFQDKIQKLGSFRLYHYSPLREIYHLFGLENEMIHLSGNTTLNDLYEGIPRIEGEEDYNSLMEEDIAKMYCFTEANDNYLMWSHYADSHKGICIEYDLSLLEDDVLRKQIFPVIYTKERKIGRNCKSIAKSIKALKEAIQKDYVYDVGETLDDLLPLLLYKGNVWQYEKEWRLVFTMKTIYDMNAKKYYSDLISFPCISAIYMGTRIKPLNEGMIRDLCIRMNKTKPVDLYKMKMEKEGYGLIAEKVSI